jgi:hypothetical protein
MNDKDKQEFEKWYSDYFKIEEITIINIPHHFTESWKAACEYKQKEIDILKNHDIAGYKEGIYCLESENKKLRDALKNFETK